MKTNYKLVLAMLASVSIGVAGATAIHAQQVKTPPAYVIAEVSVVDSISLQEYAAKMQKYGAKMPESLAPFNHHYLVRGGKTQALEGEPPKTIIVIAFDSVEKAREWYESPAYEAIKPIRQSLTKSRLFIAEGVAP